MNGLDICKAIFDTIRELINDGVFREAYRINKAFTRTRKLNFENLLFYLLNSSKKSMAINIADMIEKFPSISFPDISKQAVSKARKGINPEAFAELFRISVMKFYQDAPLLHTWNGYHVCAIDGTSLQVPQTERNLSSFGGAMNQNDSCCALASASICFDVLNDMVIDAQISPYCYGERKLAVMHINQMKCYGLRPNTLLLFDRGYPSYELYQEIQEKGFFFLMRTNGRTHASIQEDGAFLYKPKEYAGAPVSLRIVHVILQDGTVEKLVTNIFDPAITAEMFKELYILRWGVESKYREFKDRLEIEEFSGCLPVSIRQDFYITIFLSNLVSIIKMQVDLKIAEESIGKNNKYAYQANRGFIINRIHEYMIKILCGLYDAGQALEGIIKAARRCLSQIQPGRTFSRKVKMTRRTHFCNQKSCL